MVPKMIWYNSPHKALVSFLFIIICVNTHLEPETMLFPNAVQIVCYMKKQKENIWFVFT